MSRFTKKRAILTKQVWGVPREQCIDSKPALRWGPAPEPDWTPLQSISISRISRRRPLDVHPHIFMHHLATWDVGAAQSQVPFLKMSARSGESDVDDRPPQESGIGYEIYFLLASQKGRTRGHRRE